MPVIFLKSGQGQFQALYYVEEILHTPTILEVLFTEHTIAEQYAVSHCGLEHELLPVEAWL